MARQFIYHMHGLSKSYSGGKKVLDNVHLSFYPDAKIGVLGPNGAGKSTLLRIMAGIDKEFNGEAWLADGATCGYLPQEPQLDESKDVMGNVMEGVAEKQAILERYNELAMNYSDETADEMTAAGPDRCPEPVGSGQPGRAGDGCAALPAGRCGRVETVGW
jgi:ATPase subunit of ABC transporter with duplicated ATPase domains